MHPWKFLWYVERTWGSQFKISLVITQLAYWFIFLLFIFLSWKFHQQKHGRNVDQTKCVAITADFSNDTITLFSLHLILGVSCKVLGFQPSSTVWNIVIQNFCSVKFNCIGGFFSKYINLFLFSIPYSYSNNFFPRLICCQVYVILYRIGP